MAQENLSKDSPPGGIGNDQVERFARLFSGLDIAFGTGRGEWVKRPPQLSDFEDHLEGRGPGIGIAPLRPDNTVMFAAIDLDEPDFEAAREMQLYIPGVSWLERSRSGNAHVWVFFKSPCPAWVAMGLLKEATYSAEKEGVEVFPKNHDFERVRLGNYINLPFHGDERPIISSSLDSEDASEPPLWRFLEEAENLLNDPEAWEKRADWLQIPNPASRTASAEFGTQKTLHVCAQHVLSGDAGMIPYGHQNLTMFMLAKCLTNWEQTDSDETLEMLLAADRDLFDPGLGAREVRRILANVERGQYTSTGCDDPVVIPFTHPDCPIAHPKRS